MIFYLRHALLVLAVLTGIHTFAQQNPELYSRAKIILDSKDHTMMALSRLGIAVDHGDYRKNQYFISDFSHTELKQAIDAGFKVDILIRDVTKYYREQNNKPGPQKKTSGIPCDTIGRPAIDVPAHFHLGTYAGYFTLNEMNTILDSMHTLYPNLISARQAIDTYKTAYGRPLYWLRISNNPNVDQPTKPQMLYTALHHAREPMSLSATIFYMWYLLEHYNTDPKIKAIIDNTELYFIPCVNPDGYLNNITTNPLGGGMWRKNMRNNLNGSTGVDLNRNYGYLWGYDNIGSSNAGSSDTYRGASAFSEPETKAVKWFCEHHHFSLALNYHTFNNEMISPYGHVPVAYSPDSLTFSALSFYLTGYNFYRYGTCYQCLGYVENGGSDDWMYGEQTSKNKIFAWTPEIGKVANGFYPPANQIISDCSDNLPANINAAALLLPSVKIVTDNSTILTSSTGFVHFNMQRLGIASGLFTVTAAPLDNWMTIPSGSKLYPGPTLLQNISDSFSYLLDPNTPNNQAIKYVLKVNNGLYDTYDTVEVYYGKYHYETAPSTDNLGDWNSGGWNVSNTIYRTAPGSIKSGPDGGKYPDNSYLAITTNNAIDLRSSIRAYLQFYTRWDVEPKYDYVNVNAAISGTNNWTTLCGRYTKPGDFGQPTDMPVYDDHQYDWVLEEMDLTQFAGKQVDLRFDLVSDGAAPYDGFYFDDLKVVTVLDSVLNVKSLSGEKGFVVYPNPASDQVTVDVVSEGSNGARTQMYDCMGRVVNEAVVADKKAMINVRNLPSGIYYIKVFTKDAALPVQRLEILH